MPCFVCQNQDLRDCWDEADASLGGLPRFIGWLVCMDVQERYG